jgi:hypothetical protein
MIVVFSIALSVTHILKYGVQGVRHEGFEDSSEGALKKSDEEDLELNKVEKEDKIIDEKEDKKADKKEDKKADKKEKLKELRKEFPEFKDIQKQLTEGIEKMNPLFSKAENFIEKYEHYKKA